MADISEALVGRRVFMTGHTGFTGSWLALWLTEIGCEVTGYALAPETTPNLFDESGIRERLRAHDVGDIRDLQALRASMERAAPSVVVHLAAQPLVRRSYRDPLDTVSTNVVGTVSVLEAARQTDSVEAFVCVTSDKVYENREWVHPYRETDRFGGRDPYSASKACAELMTRTYQETLARLGNDMRIATARGGNIIGGGDWSEDRIIPDFFRALVSGERLKLRNPGAVRPWQHVLSACHGYLAIAAHLLSHGAGRTESWNIGPGSTDWITVEQLIHMLSEACGSPGVDYEPSPLEEAHTLLLDTMKAKHELGLLPAWPGRQAIEQTAVWYQRYYARQQDPLAICLEQLRAYRSAIGGTQREGIHT